MCGRIAHFRSEEKYLKWLKSQLPVPGPVGSEDSDRYNVAPQTNISVLHQDDDGLRFSAMRWGYAPLWAVDRTPAINARLETAATSKYWQDVWASGRCLVPVDGWFEWVGDSDAARSRQPYFIHLPGTDPMFLAAIGRFPRGPCEAIPQERGFAIITADSEGGMLDIHDRRPVALPAKVARQWLDPDLPAEQAQELARHHATPADAFTWHAVDTAVGNVRNDGPHLIEPCRPAPHTLDLFDS
ncbi:Putative SOS response-associated peptidase YedK [Halopseudomonas xinjiangensis]|uniref:Abasic site processing protein n=1 Tax=Halopseudomonas xinjiangensis TaxID=487184 RepID=A0A1H1NQN1_9GAMM|nr:SOS response-associated peptidase family protein [Halopseudomonas xinjiangensis]SDS01316.1 Putative SOS response-associated peptidase YedK [Halopseudomonas xinjiangensis]